jgi:hypothetical protein
MTILSAWENFYVIVGSSAGALIGLQFVVVTLIANMPISRDAAQAGDAFSTPSVVHFGVVLLLSAVGSAPWDGIVAFAILWGVVGFGGVVYVVSWQGVCAGKPLTKPCSRIGCFMFCFPSRPTRSLPHRPARLGPIRA